MRTIITLVASIAILGASPAPADANWQWLKKVVKAVEKPVKMPVASRCLEREIIEEVLQPTEDAAEKPVPVCPERERIIRMIDEELLQPTDDAAEKPVPERRLGCGHVSDK